MEAPLLSFAWEAFHLVVHDHQSLLPTAPRRFPVYRKVCLKYNTVTTTLMVHLSEILLLKIFWKKIVCLSSCLVHAVSIHAVWCTPVHLQQYLQKSTSSTTKQSNRHDIVSYTKNQVNFFSKTNWKIELRTLS